MRALKYFDLEINNTFKFPQNMCPIKQMTEKKTMSSKDLVLWIQVLSMQSIYEMCGIYVD